MRSNAVNRSKQFRTAWIAAFLGLALIIGAIVWALMAYGKPG